MSKAGAAAVVKSKTDGSKGGKIIGKKTCGNCLKWCTYDLTYIKRILDKHKVSGTTHSQYTSVYAADRGLCRQKNQLIERHDWCKYWEQIPNPPHPPRIWPRAGDEDKQSKKEFEAGVKRNAVNDQKKFKKKT